MRQQLLKLVRETRLFIQPERPAVERPLPPPPMQPRVETKKVEESVEPEPVKIKSSRSSATEEMNENLKRLFPEMKLLKTPCSVTLFCFDQEDFAFLQSVALAITEHFLSADVTVMKSEKECLHLLSRKYLRFVIAPLEEIKKWKAFEEDTSAAQVHQLAKLQTIPWLPLDHVKHYAQDQNRKRILWNTLKNTLPSSPILPSIKL